MERKEQNNYFTLTSVVGDFIFSKGTQLSHAKLVRDTIMGRLLLGGNGELPTPQTAQTWFHTNTNGSARYTAFEWVMNAENFLRVANRKAA